MLGCAGSSMAGTSLHPRPASSRCRASPRVAFVVEAAANKEKKGETLAQLTSFLQPEAQTTFVAGVNFKGFTVRTVPPADFAAGLRSGNRARTRWQPAGLAGAGCTRGPP
jgi:hypothetical protein